MTAAVTALIALLLAVGEFMSVNSVDSVARYVRRRNRQAVTQLRESHVDAIETATHYLAPYRHPDYAPLERFRTPTNWHGPAASRAGWAISPRIATEVERGAIEHWLTARAGKPVAGSV
jgi:hypothetical protein